jgi:hypothetical protein
MGNPSNARPAIDNPSNYLMQKDKMTSDRIPHYPQAGIECGPWTMPKAALIKDMLSLQKTWANMMQTIQPFFNGQYDSASPR